MRQVTFANLRTGAKQAADAESSSFISDPEWARILSRCYGELHGIVVSSGLRYFETSVVIVTDGIDGSYPLPSNHLATIGVDYLYPGGYREELGELMIQERNVCAGWSGQGQVYAVSGQNLVIYPTPPTGQSYELLYVAQPTDLSSASDSDLIDVVVPDGESFIYWGAAVIALAKEQTDCRTQVAEREACRARVSEWATLRALQQPRRRIVGEDAYGFTDPASRFWCS